MRPSRAALVAAFAAVYLLWGATFLALRYAVAEVPPMLTIAIRCIAGAALLYLWLLLRGERPTAGARQWRIALGHGCVSDSLPVQLRQDRITPELLFEKLGCQVTHQRVAQYAIAFATHRRLPADPQSRDCFSYGQCCRSIDL